MGDTTTIFILDAYLAFLTSGDLPFLKAVWGHLVSAARWQINRTIEGLHLFVSIPFCAHSFLNRSRVRSYEQSWAC